MQDMTLLDLQAPSARNQCRRELERCVGDAFEFTKSGWKDKALVGLKHKATRIPFAFLPSGEFLMGFSEEEEVSARKIRDPIPANLDEMRPTVKVHVKMFLVSTIPVTTRIFRQVTNERPVGHQPQDEAVLVRFEQADKFARNVGCRLPAEAQWEYACRAGTQSLFVWGDDLPPREELNKWLRPSFDESYEQSMQCNAFGLYGLFTGEWCAEEYRLNYAPAAPSLPGQHVVRGGGSMFWPWQDEEWVWCMSAMRLPESGLFADRQAGLRLVYEIAK